jgi:hypothetical protein
MTEESRKCLPEALAFWMVMQHMRKFSPEDQIELFRKLRTDLEIAFERHDQRMREELFAMLKPQSN